MSKYTEEFKLKVIEYYNKNQYGYMTVAQHFNIPAFTTVKKWVKKYNEHGARGLLKRQNTSYSGEFKQNVVKYMHENHLSGFDTAVHFNLANENIPNKWERIYYEEGPQALYEERRGRKKNMNFKSQKKKLSKENEEDLIEEVQKLRMENAYLKKLQALVQERIKPKQLKK